MSEALKKLFSSYPKFRKYERRLTVDRAYAMLEYRDRKWRKENVPKKAAKKAAKKGRKGRKGRKEMTPKEPISEAWVGLQELMHSKSTYAPLQAEQDKIKGTVRRMREEGKRPAVILDTLVAQNPRVIFPSAYETIRIVEGRERVAPQTSAPVDQTYKIGGPGFLIQVTYNERDSSITREDVIKAISTLLAS